MNLVKSTTLVGFLCASLVATLPAAAQPNSPTTNASTAGGTELPGGIRATPSADAQLKFLGQTGKVSRLSLTKGQATLSVPPGTELKLEMGGWVVQSKLSDLEVGFDGAGRPQVSCISGMVGVTDGNGAHFRLYPDSSLVMGEDGRTPAIRSRVAASTPSVAAPAAEPTAAPRASRPDPDSTVYVPPNRQRYTPPADNGGYDSEDDSEEPMPRRRTRSRDRNRDRDYDGSDYRAPQPQGPNTGQVIMQNLPGVLMNVLPFMLNRNQGYFPGGGYYPGGGYFPGGGGYMPGGGYFPNNGGYYPRW